MPVTVKMLILLLFTSILLFSCSSRTGQHANNVTEQPDTLGYPQEIHLKNLRQLTFGGDNAEAYFSFDNTMITFQVTNSQWGFRCDQICCSPIEGASMDVNKPKMISTGLGRTTCSYFMPGNKAILYASTHAGNPECPSVPKRRADGKYVWAIYPDYDIYVADLQGNIIDTLTNTPGYDAEATVSPQGDKIVFTSLRSGDLELYTMNLDGSDVKQVTHELGYDGGAFFSHDGSILVFRSSRPNTDEDIRIYKELLAEGLVMPTNMEIYVCNVDGSNLQQITNLGKANWAPFFHPSGQKIIFSSNHASDRGYQFNLYMINLDGTGLEQITFDPVFDAFPMFSFDGKRLIFSSNRNNKGTRDTNLFIAEWVD
jgi:dipeptidyl aminopeptidase/acylaminoacyl peptidase